MPILVPGTGVEGKAATSARKEENKRDVRYMMIKRRNEEGRTSQQMGFYTIGGWQTDKNDDHFRIRS
jgi:hypothetical protein